MNKVYLSNDRLKLYQYILNINVEPSSKELKELRKFCEAVFEIKIALTQEETFNSFCQKLIKKLMNEVVVFKEATPLVSAKTVELLNKHYGDPLVV